ncbi:uncharacterized protein LOC116196893 [Punica granatum]|uniref:Uncharacterized protein n=2 Tax=Punica granatum TaxID=22663 RepID=A0A218X289_PUNGR|nr:uncharacterized protein LOC116196893 [Punica granatum]OWM79315.1 hypothetical protein CDL15_Pgr003488 [Punica granatum]PKI50294.1 hypothetical protein CRG98_029367 [Punica granatum]
MPLTGFATDAFGVVTICLVALLILLGLLCILYLFYFRARIRGQGFIQLNYFNGPWIIRITFILFAIWWGLGEITRLHFLRREGRLFNSLSFKWQETICKCYIILNLGFAEPCLFLTLVFLLRAPLENMESGILSQRWNGKTAGYILLYCFPVFILQLILALAGPRLDKLKSAGKLPHYFTSAVRRSDDTALCTYPLLSTILLGLFALVLTAYLFWLGRQILRLVLNKGLQRRVKALIFSASGFLPVRVLFLGLSVLSKPEQLLFEALAFLAFLAVLSCAGLCICVLVYCPVADSLAVGNLHDLESRRRVTADYNETSSLISNHGESSAVSLGRNSDASTKRGSISFRAYEKDESSMGTSVELSLFSPSRDSAPSLLGWPLHTAAENHEP